MRRGERQGGADPEVSGLADGASKKDQKPQEEEPVWEEREWAELVLGVWSLYGAWAVGVAMSVTGGVQKKDGSGRGLTREVCSMKSQANNGPLTEHKKNKGEGQERGRLHRWSKPEEDAAECHVFPTWISVRAPEC